MSEHSLRFSLVRSLFELNNASSKCVTPHKIYSNLKGAEEYDTHACFYIATFQPLPPVPVPNQPLPPVPVPNQPLPPVPVPNQLLPSSLVANQPLPANRFTLLSETELEASTNARIPKNTKRSTNWGISVWEDWCKARGIDKPIESLSAHDINNHTAHFVQEARKRNGEESQYPAASLTNIVSAIQRYLRENVQKCPSLMKRIFSSIN